MAVYYINPHTPTNGTGTWASPFSLASTVRTASFVSGDELRVVGAYKTDLFTATSYTATITDNYRITVTAGGALGADFATGDIVYIENYNTLFSISSSSSNTLTSSAGSNSMLPMLSTANVGTSITIRKVNRTAYPGINATSAYFFNNNLSLSNITISDNWVAEDTRITDNTALTLIYTTQTSLSLLVNNASIFNSNWTINLDNSHITTLGSATLRIFFRLSYSTINIYGMYSNFAFGGSGIFFNVESTGISSNNTVTVQHATSSLCTQSGGVNNTFNSINSYLNSASYLLTTSGIADGCVFTYTNVLLRNNSSYIVPSSNITYDVDWSLNLLGDFDHYPTSALAAIVNMNTASFRSLTLGPDFKVYSNRRTSMVTTSQYLIDVTQSTTNTTLTDITINSTSFPGTYTISKYRLGINASVGDSRFYNKKLRVLLDDDNYLGGNTNYSAGDRLLIFKNGTPPHELLVSRNHGNFGNGQSGTSSLVKVSTDDVFYKNTSPSLKAYLESYSSIRWPDAAYCAKTILVPCTQAQSVTISGYMYSNISSILSTDVTMQIVLDEELVTQQSVPASFNTWQQFSITFTPTKTAEYVLVWKMHFPNSGTIWLSDLTIT